MSGAIAVLYVVGIIAAGMAINLGGWTLVIRLLDSVSKKRVGGETIRFEFFVATRHLRGHKSGFLTLVGALSILGVSVSSCNLASVLSIMGGFSGDLKEKILQTNAHVVVDNTEGFKDWRAVLEKVRKAPDVLAATPVLQGEMMMNARSNNHAILLKGIDLASFGQVSSALRTLDKGDRIFIDKPEKLFDQVRDRRAKLYGALDSAAADAGTAQAEPKEKEASRFALPAPSDPRERALPAVIVGRELSDALRLYVGEEVNIISPLGQIGPTGRIPKSRPFRIGGVFFSGMYEFDSLFVYTSLSAVQTFTGKGDAISEIHVAVRNPDSAAAVAANLSKLLGKQHRVRAWSELNASLFAALKLEKIAVFITLIFMSLVASFCIMATLAMLVIEKGADVSILMTLGASSRQVSTIFRFEGMLIGSVGTISGLIVACGLCSALKHVGLPIDPEVWYIDKLPVNMEWFEFLLVGLASIGITQLATLYPAYKAAQLTPVEGLKYD